jgi:glycosyltransferase involved in cell wall biosynthesis
MSNGWLVNDRLTCIPGTRTFWHDLLSSIQGLQDKTFGGCDFSELPEKIEYEFDNIREKPDYILRNATFFRKLRIKIPTISLLQDAYEGVNRYEKKIIRDQIDVCNNSSIVVFNSPYTQSFYKNKIKSQQRVIPLGTDFSFFKPEYKKKELQNKLDIKSNSILFVGAGNDYPKGFDIVKQLIKQTSYNFCLVMKDNFKINHQRVRVFNNISHRELREVYNSCSLLICTSRRETQHLAGVEAAACGLPIIATNVGIYYGRRDGDWGLKAKSVKDFIEGINVIFNNYEKYSPREYFLSEGFDKKTSMTKWQEVIQEAH